ncbi:MAG TPA: FKBP-type peptidyl-prolyl cis-trans isomerase [Thiobacillaceae bacterium]|nr:FKBP-type peptidyl-prolyl cis-trans isomerase [Thiobacillaceae bacterium]HNU64469.1 FKBP-type peptidyl-prolyl cis-trans isomerase [Thiobacillaceae bacterium]
MTGLRPGDRVTLHYRLTCADTEVVNTFPHAPETFTLGTGELEARLELLLLGLEAGQHRVFELAPGEAFGHRDEQLVHTLPRGDFPADMELAPGYGVRFDLPNGQSMMGTVRALTDTDVTMDFNHFLAGLPVTLEVRILAIDMP